jgi:hypothetical protein
MSGIEGGGGLSRRDLMKRGAVVGGTVVWATPVLQTLATPAFAGTPGEEGCPEGKVLHKFKFDVDQITGQTSCSAGGTTSPGGGCSFPGWADAEAGDCSGSSAVWDPNTNCVTITFSPDCEAESATAIVKTGSADGFCVANPPTSGSGSTLIVCGITQDISFVAVLICCAA